MAKLRKSNRPTPDPPPEEIERLCEAIRAGWSEAERKRRLVAEEEPVECRRVPVGPVRDA